MDADTRSLLFVGQLDSCKNGRLKGWAIHRVQPQHPVRLHVLIDNQEIAQVLCSEHRPDVAKALGLEQENTGFQFTIPDAFFDSRPHVVALRFPDRSALMMPDPETPDRYVDHVTISGEQAVTIEGVLDGIKQGVLRGWALRSTRSAPRRGGVILRVTADGAQIAQVRADRYRGDVAAALGCDPNCGYEIVLPTRFRGSTPHAFRVFAEPSGQELGGSPYTSSVPNDLLETRLVDIASTIDHLQKELTRLRAEIRDVIPRPGYNLGGYDLWARRYYADLHTRLMQARADAPLIDAPLVSILCPTYKPLMRDFEAAIDSVISQTYRNWELIIIDDGGKSPEVAARIAAYCKSDPRIRALTLKKNQGISNATNVGMDAAKGQYTAFFDHDDLLVPEAIEVMVRAAERTGGKLIYSDEDKIDQAGYFLDPNLKPDYNYRYLLGCNYICHLTMIDSDVMRQIGHLRREYDGAQDHDFVLRATEALAPAQIVHVPEILYHWRLTPNSTAVSIGNKQYAVDAGVKAVSDHLKRRGTPGVVEPINAMTIYRVMWKIKREPKVSIIIPFKDQIETTAQCVDALLSKTAYKNFEIVLVDNWSFTAEAARFIRKVSGHPQVRVITVEEPFNYSRLNNIAIASCTSDYLMFMNNDVFVNDDRWLKLLVGEALASPDIGAVGMKLLYPTDTVQHTGVAVGPAAVAAHVHLGRPDDDYGYIGRARLSNEVTAVTAAAMLVRASVCREVGGFDEVDLKVAYNDVDFCLKIRAAGYRIVFCADAIAYHHESLSRGSDQTPEHEARFFTETQAIQKRWSDHPLYLRDPAYPRFFTVDRLPYFDLRDPSDLEAVPL